MTAQHFELLVEEPSAEAFLRELMPRLLPQGRTFQIHPFQGKSDLLAKLTGRLRGYANWLPEDWRIVVLVDRDQNECGGLKAELESIAAIAGLRTRTASQKWQLVNRISIEELEAWYFGEWDAVRSAYPRASTNLVGKRGFRNPDAIAGGTWEAFERVMQKSGYFKGGLRKVEAARAIGARFTPDRCSSRSFTNFRAAIEEAV
jgi:hypothetical protein